MPCTFRNVSCWPANEASGRSSAVAEAAHGETRHCGWSAARQRVVGADRVPRDAAGKGVSTIQRADRGAGLGECAHVVDIERAQPRAGCARQDRSCSRNCRKAMRRGGKTAGHAHPAGGQLADHLAEAGVLAAHHLDVGHPQFFERARPGRSPGWPVMQTVTWESSVMLRKPGAFRMRARTHAGRGDAATRWVVGFVSRLVIRVVRGCRQVHESRRCGRNDEIDSKETCSYDGFARLARRRREEPTSMHERIRVLCLGRHRHHRRDLRQLASWRNSRRQTAPCAPALHRQREDKALVRGRRDQSSRLHA